MTASPISSATRAPLRRPASRQEASRSASPTGTPDFRPVRLVLSDDDLRRHVFSRLSQFGPQIARAVATDVRNGEVTLVGDVDSDYERRLVEHSISRLAGVGRLENRLRVRSDKPAPAQISGLARTPALSTRSAALAAGAAGTVALGWGLWQLAAACTG